LGCSPSDPSRERANIQFHVQPLSLDRFGEPLHTFPAYGKRMQYPADEPRRCAAALGRPAASPAIRPNYLATDEDRSVAPIRCASCGASWRNRRCAASSPRISARSSVGDDDASLVKAAGDIGTPFFTRGHRQDGTDSDPFAVVDERLRVLGLEGLRVIDASVMRRSRRKYQCAHHDDRRERRGVDSR